MLIYVGSKLSWKITRSFGHNQHHLIIPLNKVTETSTENSKQAILCVEITSNRVLLHSYKTSMFCALSLNNTFLKNSMHYLLFFKKCC